MADIDFEKEGLLEGLDGEERESRRKLLEELVDDGFELEYLREAVEQNRLALLPGGDRPAAASPSTPPTRWPRRPSWTASSWRSCGTRLGMPVAEEDEAAYTKADVDAAKSVKEIEDAGLPEEGVLELSRAMSQSMATLAASVGRVFGDAFMREGDNELDLARRYTVRGQGHRPARPA